MCGDTSCCEAVEDVFSASAKQGCSPKQSPSPATECPLLAIPAATVQPEVIRSAQCTHSQHSRSHQEQLKMKE